MAALTVTCLWTRFEEMAEVAFRYGRFDCRDIGAIVCRSQPRFVAYAQTSWPFGGMLIVQRRVRPPDRVRVCAAPRGRGDSSTVARHSRPSLLTKTPNQTLQQTGATRSRIQEHRLRRQHDLAVGLHQLEAQLLGPAVQALLQPRPLLGRELGLAPASHTPRRNASRCTRSAPACARTP